MNEQRIPTSVTRIGRFTVRVYDEQAYAENIRRYYANDVPTSAQKPNRSEYVPFEKKKSAARFDWTRWRSGPMIEEQAV